MKKYTDAEKFLTSVGNIKKCDLHLEMYVNKDYECICGKTHTFTYDTEVLAQGAFKLILGCPDSSYNVNCVK